MAKSDDDEWLSVIQPQRRGRQSGDLPSFLTEDSTYEWPLWSLHPPAEDEDEGYAPNEFDEGFIYPPDEE